MFKDLNTGESKLGRYNSPSLQLISFSKLQNTNRSAKQIKIEKGTSRVSQAHAPKSVLLLYCVATQHEPKQSSSPVESSRLDR